MPGAAPLLEARGISKRFIAVQALDRVDAAFRAGEVVAVMGENGAGKSTLMKCLAGVHAPDAGEVWLEGRRVTIRGVREAEALGIAFIHQELNLAGNLSVGANIFLGREPRRGGPLGWIDRAAVRSRAAALLAQLELAESPDTLVSELSIGHQQMVEIAKALSQKARVLIMDEPTSSLTHHETQTLFGLVKRLREDGMAVVFISHRIGEVEEIADRVIVLRDGRNSGELGRDEIEHDRIVSLMVGRDLTAHEKAAPEELGMPRLTLRGLRTRAFPRHAVSFELRAGEIVGMAGLVGAGRTELARTVFGIDRKAGGQVLVDGRASRIQGPRSAMRAGIAYVPEDRKAQGAVVDFSIRDNMALASLGELQAMSFVLDGGIDRLAERTRERLSIRTPTIEQPVRMLSGGNQQKVVIGKWVARNPGVFLLDEPTRGIDVRSKGQIYQLIEELARSGAAVLVISSDLEEVLRISDRVLVMHEGRLAGELGRAEMSEESIMQLATGQTTDRTTGQTLETI